MKVALFVSLSLTVGLLSRSVYATDRCIGAVVNGQCVGVIQPDYSRPSDPPATMFLPNHQGIPTSPTPGPGFEGNQFHNYTTPVLPGGQLRWADPNTLRGNQR